VRMNLHFEYPASVWTRPGTWIVTRRTWGNRYLWLRLSGPGKVGVQSHFAPVEDPGNRMDSFEPNATEVQW